MTYANRLLFSPPPSSLCCSTQPFVLSYLCASVQRPSRVTPCLLTSRRLSPPIYHPSPFPSPPASFSFSPPPPLHVSTLHLAVCRLRPLLVRPTMRPTTPSFYFRIFQPLAVSLTYIHTPFSLCLPPPSPLGSFSLIIPVPNSHRARFVPYASSASSPRSPNTTIHFSPPVSSPFGARLVQRVRPPPSLPSPSSLVLFARPVHVSSNVSAVLLLSSCLFAVRGPPRPTNVSAVLLLSFVLFVPFTSRPTCQRVRRRSSFSPPSPFLSVACPPSSISFDVSAVLILSPFLSVACPPSSISFNVPAVLLLLSLPLRPLVRRVSAVVHLLQRAHAPPPASPPASSPSSSSSLSGHGRLTFRFLLNNRSRRRTLTTDNRTLTTDS